MRPKNLGLSDEQVHQLETLASRPKTAQRSVYRAKIILSRLAGVDVRATAKAMNCKPATVRKWCRRVAAQGLDGLNDAQRSGINNLIKRIKRIGFGVPPLRPLPHPSTPLRRQAQLGPTRNRHSR